MNPDFYSKMSIVNHERGVIPSSVKFSVHNMKTFLRNCVGENVESRTEKNVSDQKKNTAH